jgi:hypothetical protein
MCLTTAYLVAKTEKRFFFPLEGRQLPYACQVGVSYNTVRTQLARAMARAESRSQVELVLLWVAGAIGDTIWNPMPS